MDFANSNGVSVGVSSYPTLGGSTWRIPSMDIPFSGTLDPRITFARNSTATYVNSAGLVVSVAVNVPRFDCTISSAAPLLIESQATNLCLQSNALGTAPWSASKGGAGGTCVVTNNYATAPDGTSTASRVQASLGGGTTTADLSLVAQAITSGSAATGSFWIKTTDGSTQTVYVRGNTDKTITVNGVWQRYPFPAGTMTANPFGIGARGGMTPACSNSVDVLVWGSQLETGGRASSTIPTTTASATRLADELVMSGTNFTSWFNALEGTLVAQFAEDSTAISGNKKTIASITSGNFNNEMSLSIDAGANGRFRTVDGGVAQADFNFTSSVAANTFYKIAGAYKLNNSNAAQSGVAKTADTSCTVPAVAFLDIGCSSQNSSGALNTVGDQLNGWLQRITYYPTRLPDATLQAITT